jgi:type I restriction enzyme, R subunit
MNTDYRTEAETRAGRIDIELVRAGWSRDRRNLIEEFGLTVDEPKSLGSRNQFADYVLLGTDGRPLAVVEAKRSSRDAIAGKRQAADYADLIAKRVNYAPFIFLTNGKEIWFWDRTRYPERKVAGFYTRDDLERLAHQRRFAEPLNSQTIDAKIAGRDYQNEAIRRVSEGIDHAKRKFLLVMATGTGKTRTTIALIDVLLKAKRVQRVLFLADRRELVRQAMSEFKAHLPNESLVRIEGGETSRARIQFATYPSMMQVYERLSVGHFDFIVADESHRSIYQRYKALFDHFDAIQLGLTATPTDYIDHNTFQLFDCGDGIPSYYYSYEQAVDDKNLVNYRVFQAQTRFQIKGIQGDELPESLKQMARDQGQDPEELSFEGTDIEHKVVNQGTNDSLVLEFMDRCRKDLRGLPHKSIFFAVSHAHAVRLLESFNRLYPELQRLGLAEVIDSHMERADSTLDDFKFKQMPRIAISVDMLDTGVDVPAIQNLVFAKPIFSRVKFWQMIGRGTRLWSDPASGEVKPDFLIIDHWNNFAYFKLNPEGEIDRPTEPLPVRLFRLRLEKWLLLHAEQQDATDAVNELQTMVASLPRQSINVRPHLDEIDELIREWPKPESQTHRFLSASIAPLMRLAPFWMLDEIQFRIHCERVSVAWLKGDKAEQEKAKTSISEALTSLADNVPAIKSVAEQRAWALSEGFWEHLDLDRLKQMQDTFAPLMKFRRSTPQIVVELNLPDAISSRQWIIYGPTGEGAFAENYRAQVEILVRNLAEQLPALSKLKRGENLSGDDLDEISRALNQADLFVTEETLRQTYGQPTAQMPEFLKHILGLAVLPSWDDRINAAFEKFIAEHGYLRASQLNYLRAVKAATQRRAKLTHAALNAPPFSRVGNIETLFQPQEIDELVAFANSLVDEAA